MSNIRKGDNVVVITGSDKGKKGSVLKVFPKESRALVQGARPRRNRPAS
jgi:large subunit ribosomal protein L24